MRSRSMPLSSKWKAELRSDPAPSPPSSGDTRQLDGWRVVLVPRPSGAYAVAMDGPDSMTSRPAASGFTFEFRLAGTGWAWAKVGDDSSSAEVTASYLGDALGDLLAAIRTVLDGDAVARCSWWEEPGEYRWIFVRENRRVTLRLLEFDRLWSDAPDHDGRLIFQTSQSLRVMALAMSEGAAACLDEWGHEGYRATWVENDFPADELAAIQTLLARPSASDLE